MKVRTEETKNFDNDLRERCLCAQLYLAIYIQSVSKKLVQFASKTTLCYTFVLHNGVLIANCTIFETPCSFLFV